MIQVPMMQLELLNQFMSSCQIELPNFVADLVKALCKELVVSVEDVQLCSIFLAPYSDVS